MQRDDKVYHFLSVSNLPNGDEMISPIDVKYSDFQLTKIEQLLLVAALLQDKGPTSDFAACTGKILRQALRLSGFSLDAINELWQQAQSDINTKPALVDEYYEVLIRLTDAGYRKPERHQYPLFEGQGNWGIPEGSPPAFPDYNACRLTFIGEEIARDLLEWHPEYSKLRMPQPPLEIDIYS